MNFQQPNPWVADCTRYLSECKGLALHSFHKRSIPRINCFDLICFTQQAGIACDTVDPDILLQRLRNLLSKKAILRAITEMLEPRDSSKKKRRHIQQQYLCSVPRMVFWERILLHCGYGQEEWGWFQSEVWDPMKRQLMLNAIQGNQADQELRQAHHNAGDLARHDEFLETKLWDNVNRWLPARDILFLDALLAAPHMIQRLTPGQRDVFCLRYALDFRDTTAKTRDWLALIRLTSHVLLVGEVPDEILSSYYMMVTFRCYQDDPQIRMAVENSVLLMLTISDSRIQVGLKLLSIYPDRQKVLPLFEAQERYLEAIKSAPLHWAAKLIASSQVRDRWLNEYPEIAEHVLQCELGV